MNFFIWIQNFIDSNLIIITIILLAIIISKILISYNYRLHRIMKIINIASKFGEFQKNEMKLPKVSILIPAWNEEKLISNCIESLLNLDYPHKEIIIIAGGSDNTFEIAKKYENIHVLIFKQEIPNKNKALNVGLKHSTGEIITLSDADCIFPHDWLDNYAKKFCHEKIKVISGNHRPFNSQLQIPLVAYTYLTGFIHHFDFLFIEENEIYELD